MLAKKAITVGRFIVLSVGLIPFSAIFEALSLFSFLSRAGHPYLPRASLIIPLIGLAAADFGSFAKTLSMKGASAVAPAQIKGRSGVRHEFALALLAEPGKAKVVLDAELSTAEVDEVKVLKFYVKVFDVAPEKAVLCVSPKLAQRAAALAKEYDIVVLEDESPLSLVSKAEKFVEQDFKAVPR
jgi:hypothetical protein